MATHMSCLAWKGNALAPSGSWVEKPWSPVAKQITLLVHDYQRQIEQAQLEYQQNEEIASSGGGRSRPSSASNDRCHFYNSAKAIVGTHTACRTYISALQWRKRITPRKISLSLSGYWDAQVKGPIRSVPSRCQKIRSWKPVGNTTVGTVRVTMWSYYLTGARRSDRTGG